MGEKTGIAWTDHTFNIAWGCTKVSAGCASCYAEAASNRFGFDVWGPVKERRTFGEKHWNEPLRWNRDAVKEGRRHRVFCSSMCDVFEDHPTIQAELGKLAKLVMLTPWLDWQILTKRADRMKSLAPLMFGCPPTPAKNVWLGVSVEDQKTADERIPLLLQTPAAMRFVSAEPLLGPVDISPWLKSTTLHHLCADVSGLIRNRHFDCLCDDEGRPLEPREAEDQLRRLQRDGVRVIKATNCDSFDNQKGCLGHPKPGLDWIIVGGESGPKARPFDIAWARKIIADCKAAGVACFVKQLGARPRHGHTQRWTENGRECEVYGFAEPEEPFKDRKGGDMAEWPEDLRVREWPDAH